MLKIAMTGSTGLIGSRIIELLEGQFEFLPILQSEVDITDDKQITEKIARLDFDLMLHLAGYTNVDGAETQRDLAYAINVTGTKNVYDAVVKKNKKLIYISTDFVFDGKNPPYDETDAPHPIGYYAETKYEGEKIVKDSAMIIRLSYPYRARFEAKSDLVKTIISLLRAKKQIRLVTDSRITPTFIDDIARAFSHLFNHFAPTTYHIVGTDSMSPYDAGLCIADVFSLDSALIQKTSYDSYFKNKAKRPRYSDIISKNNTFYRMKSFEQGLTEVKKQIEK